MNTHRWHVSWAVTPTTGERSRLRVETQRSAPRWHAIDCRRPQHQQHSETDTTVYSQVLIYTAEWTEQLEVN